MLKIPFTIKIFMNLVYVMSILCSVIDKETPKMDCSCQYI